DQIQVAGRAAVATRLALASQAYAAAVAHSRRNVHAQALDRAHGAAAATGRAGLVHGHLQGNLCTGHRLVEGDRDLRLEVRSLFGPRLGAHAPAAGRPAEQVGQDVAHRGGAEVEVAEAAEAAVGTRPRG